MIDIKEEILRKVGLVIPVYKTDYILPCIDALKKSNGFTFLQICIVNDGQLEVKELLDSIEFPNNVNILHLEKNVQFAKANNLGWDYLVTNYPDIEYLGTLNDDTLVNPNWLGPLIKTLEEDTSIGICSPVMEVEDLNGSKRIHESYRLQNSKKPIVGNGKVQGVKIVDAIIGFCFLGRKELLASVGFFDCTFRNSCEDIDLCLKVIHSSEYKIAMNSESVVFHHDGSSRFDDNTNTSTGHAKRLLRRKWGGQLKGTFTFWDHILNWLSKYVIDRE